MPIIAPFRKLPYHRLLTQTLSALSSYKKFPSKCTVDNSRLLSEACRFLVTFRQVRIYILWCFFRVSIWSVYYTDIAVSSYIISSLSISRYFHMAFHHKS